MGQPNTIRGLIACLKFGRVPGSSVPAMWLVDVVMGAQHASLNLKWKLESFAYGNLGDDPKSASTLPHQIYSLHWLAVR
jgi:hypothetical protein